MTDIPSDEVSAGESRESAFDLKHFLKYLPDTPGVYRMLDAQHEIIYVGKAKNLQRRVKSYFHKNHHDVKTQQMVAQIARVEITMTRTEYEALVLESNLIKNHRPKYNIIFKDDKSYPFVWITPGSFPRVIAYRGRNVKGGELLGPFPDAHRLRDILSELQKNFQFRQCEDATFRHRSRPCLQYQIGRCSAPCVGYITQEEYQQDIRAVAQVLLGRETSLTKSLEQKMNASAEVLEFEKAARYRDQLESLKELQEKQFVFSVKPSDVDVVVVKSAYGLRVVVLLCVRDGKVLSTQPFWFSGEGLDTEILEAFFEQYYGVGPGRIPAVIVTESLIAWPESLRENDALPRPELQVPRQGERKEWLRLADLNAHQILHVQSTAQDHQQAQWKRLADRLGVGMPMTRIECFDISHTQGHLTVASCVVFDEKGPMKAEYRRFNISGITPGDDYAALHQAILRRYQRLQAEEKTFPSVVIIDGGPNQLAQAVKVWEALSLPSEVRLMSISKGESRKAGLEALHFAGEPHPVAWEEDAPELHLLQRIRDEAHRFAIQAHRTQRAKEGLSLKLREIPGVGPRRAQQLLRHFGGWAPLKTASLEEISEVPGVGAALAKTIYDYVQEA